MGQNADLRPPNALCVVGEIGSGKTVVARALNHDFGYAYVNSGRTLAALLGVPPVPQTPRPVFQDLTEEFFRDPQGGYRLAHALLECAKQALVVANRVVFDGVRHRATLAALRSLAIVPVRIVFVLAPIDFAYTLVEAREAAPISPTDFRSLRRHPAEGEVGSLLGDATVVLVNLPGTDLRHLVGEMMQEVGVNSS